MFFLLSEMSVFVNKKIKTGAAGSRLLEMMSLWTQTNVVDAQGKIICIILDNNIRNEKTLLSINARHHYTIVFSLFFTRFLSSNPHDCTVRHHDAYYNKFILMISSIITTIRMAIVQTNNNIVSR